MLHPSGVASGVFVVAPQLAQLLPVGRNAVGNQRLDSLGSLFDDAVAPALGAVVALNRLPAFVIDFGERGLDGVGIARAQQFAEKLVVAFQRAALVLYFVRQRDGLEYRLVQRNSRQLIRR